MTDTDRLPDHVARNRVSWDEVNAPFRAEQARRSWGSDEMFVELAS